MTSIITVLIVNYLLLASRWISNYTISGQSIALGTGPSHQHKFLAREVLLLFETSF